MKNSIYNIYNKEIKKIINNENTKAIYLVGSSKNVDLQSDNTLVNDIDLFVFTKNGDKQTRIVKYIENIEFESLSSVISNIISYLLYSFSKSTI